MYEDLVRDLRDETYIYHFSRDYLQNIMFAAADAIEAMCEMVATAHGELANVIQSYEESKPRWIPVAERLPEELKYVLVRYKNNEMAVACWFDGYGDGLSWRVMIDGGWCTDCDTAPIHWMPLPEPPKEEEK